MRTGLTLIAAFFFLWEGVYGQAGSDEAMERNRRGAELLKQGRVEAAIVELQKATELNPNYAVAHLNLAYAYDRQGRIEEAILEYLRAIELEPGNPLAHNNLGVLYDKKGLYDEAIGQFEKALGIDPANPLAVKNLENAKKSKAVLQDNERRLDQAKRAVEAQPQSPQASYNLARLYAFYGRKDEAIEWLSKALELGFKDLDYLKADPALESLRNDPSFIRLLPAR